MAKLPKLLIIDDDAELLAKPAHVRRLREKLGVAAKYITTIPCVGYKLVPPGAEMRR